MLFSPQFVFADLASESNKHYKETFDSRTKFIKTDDGWEYRMRPRRKNEDWYHYFCEVPLSLAEESRLSLLFDGLGLGETLFKIHGYNIFKVDNLGFIIVVKTENIVQTVNEIFLKNERHNQSNVFHVKTFSYEQSDYCPEDLYFLNFNIPYSELKELLITFPNFKAQMSGVIRNETEVLKQLRPIRSIDEILHEKFNKE